MEISPAVGFGVLWIALVAIVWYLLDWATQRRWLPLRSVWLLLCLALILRIVPAIVSGYDPRFNNYDIDSYRIDVSSFLAHQDIYTNPAAAGRHPYLPFQIYFITAAGVLADLLHTSFVALVKILPIIADVGIVRLVYGAAQAQSGDRAAAFRLGLLYAFNPISILIVSYHGQFDSIPVFFSLAAAYTLQYRRLGRFSPAAAGLLLGLAILDKTWPVIFLPILLPRGSNWSERLYLLVAALALPALSVAFYCSLFSTLPINIIAAVAWYGSIAGFWGWTYAGSLFAGSVEAILGLAQVGKLVAAICLAFFYLLVSPRQALVTAMLNVVLVLFAVTQGFSLQYLMWPLAFALLTGGIGWTRAYVAIAFLWMLRYYSDWYGFASLFGRVDGLFLWAPVAVWLFTLVWMALNLRKTPLPRVDPYLVLLILFSLPAAVPLLNTGYFWSMRGGQFSTYILFEFNRVLRDGILYPRWLPDFSFGYGYPFFNVYSPGTYYVAELFHLFGFDPLTATQVVSVLTIPLSGLALFGLARRLTGSSRVALLFGLGYIYLCGILAGAFRYSAFEASVALVFLPLALWSLHGLALQGGRIWLVGAAAAYGAIGFTHAGLALVVTPLLGLWVVLLLLRTARQRPNTLHDSFISQLVLPALPPLAAMFLGLGLIGVFAVPAALEYPFVTPDDRLVEYYGFPSRGNAGSARLAESKAEERVIGLAELMRYQQDEGGMTSTTAWVKEPVTGSDMADAWLAGLKIRTRVVTTDYAPEVLWIGVLPGGVGMRTNGERIAFAANGDDLAITFKMYYYPGWRAYMVKPWSTAIIRELPIEVVDPSGNMRVPVARGADQWLLLRFEDTPPRIAGQWISICSLLAVFGVVLSEIRGQTKSRS